jgi:hypothetical protein
VLACIVADGSDLKPRVVIPRNRDKDDLGIEVIGAP